ncbi:MAG: D-2-hydroxyacid dehydrogenase [Bryobacteraceae bacterium]|nr:D-2-hydroxyacid dehydrogenase [Bryobacteraceae bacterium]
MAAHTVLVLGNPTARHLRLLDQLPPETNVAVGETLEAFANLAPQADVIFQTSTDSSLWPALHAMTPQLKWVHSLWVGVDKLLTPEFLASPVPLTNARGAYSKSLAEFCILGILFHAKNVRRLLRQEAAAHWEKFDSTEIYGQTLGIIGYGDIGKEIAKRGQGMGLKVHALRRNPAQSVGDAVLEKSYGPGQMHEMLAVCDYVALALPHTPDTVGVMGKQEFAAMKRSAVVLNVGRGTAINEAELIAALEAGTIAGAALDVFESEPLPASSPLWKMDNCFISPHTADNTHTWLDDSTQIFVDNFRRYAAGEPLRNIVDKQAGY